MDDFLLRADEYISKYLKEDFSLEEMASFCGYSTFHFSRKFKLATGKTVMEYVREKKIYAAAELLAQGSRVCNAAMEFGFDTHAGFTKAFLAVTGCNPQQYSIHRKTTAVKGMDAMKENKVVIRSIRTEDVNDLWENVYSAMTPKQITEIKILPSMEREKSKSGIELVAEVNGCVMMTLPMIKPFWLPIGYLFDNNYVETGEEKDNLMIKLLDEMKVKCHEMSISTLVSPQRDGSESEKAFLDLGFQKAWSADGWTYLMMSI